jgi:hypothetical protein
MGKSARVLKKTYAILYEVIGEIFSVHQIFRVNSVSMTLISGFFLRFPLPSFLFVQSGANPSCADVGVDRKSTVLIHDDPSFTILLWSGSVAQESNAENTGAQVQET